MISFGDAARCERLGRYIVAHGATVRETAKAFQISKSTVHKDVRTVLRNTNRSLWAEAVAVLEKNKNERHLRGGEATRRKYKKAPLSAQTSKEH